VACSNSSQLEATRRVRLPLIWRIYSSNSSRNSSPPGQRREDLLLRTRATVAAMMLMPGRQVSQRERKTYILLTRRMMEVRTSSRPTLQEVLSSPLEGQTRPKMYPPQALINQIFQSNPQRFLPTCQFSNRFSCSLPLLKILLPQRPWPRQQLSSLRA
jgi:hypothetical protein